MNETRSKHIAGNIVEPITIAIFGRRNSGKSSLINLLTGQSVAIVSDRPGTTTDPVSKRLEVSGLGIVRLVDTAGIDDRGELGSMRVARSLEALKQADMVVLLIAENVFGSYEMELIAQFEQWNLPFIVVHNKSDIEVLNKATLTAVEKVYDGKIIDFSCTGKGDRGLLTAQIREMLPQASERIPPLFADLLKPKDRVLLVMPIDSAAPKGRLILPQNQAVRALLDLNCIGITVQEEEVEDVLQSGIRPALVVSDSKIFDTVSKQIPEEIPLTSFSILFARQKGDFAAFLEGTPAISKLKENDHILILEFCTHHSSCDDIGRVKIPALLQKHTGLKLSFTHISGLSELPKDVSRFDLVVQCGGCMVTRRQLLNRLRPFREAGIPITNYGMLLAYVNGIFERAVRMFL